VTAAAAGLGAVGGVAVAGTVVGLGALRSIRRDPGAYTRPLIVASMASVALVVVPCLPISALCLYLGVSGLIVGWSQAGTYTALGVVFALISVVCVSTLRAMDRCRREVQR
jgi:hypothetical protein